jgi:hypothetical protein
MIAWTPFAHGGAPCASTLDHHSRIVYASGARPPGSDAGGVENQVAARDETHQRLVGSERVPTLLEYTL